MKIVYSLIDQGKVFYIGCTKDVYNRYKQHCIGDNYLPVYYYVQNMIIDGRLPKIKVIAVLEEKEALLKEKKLIEAFTAAGHTLLNDTHSVNAYITRLKPPERNNFRIKIRLPKTLVKELKEKQQKAIDKYNYNKKISEWYEKNITQR